MKAVSSGKQPVTRNELDQILDNRFEKFFYKLEDMFTKLRSDFYDKIDPFLREIETAREIEFLQPKKLPK